MYNISGVDAVPSQIAKFIGPVRGPHVGPMNLAVRVYMYLGHELTFRSPKYTPAPNVLCN